MKLTYNLNPWEIFILQMRSHFRFNRTAYLFFLAMETILIENVVHYTVPIILMMSLPLLLLISAILDNFIFLKKKYIAAIGGNLTIEIEDDFLRIEDEDGNSSILNLHFVISVIQKRGIYLVGFKNFNQLQIPVRVFETKEEEELFLKLIKGNMGTPRKNKSEDVLD